MDQGRGARKYLRKSVEFPVKVQVVSSHSCPRGIVPGTGGVVQSFGAGGLGMDTLLPLKEGDLVLLEFTLPRETRVVKVEAEVRGVRELKKTMKGKNLKSMGLKFLRVTASDQQYFLNYMTTTFLVI